MICLCNPVNMTSVTEFVDASSWALLDKFTKKQVFEVAEHYGIDVGGSRGYRYRFGYWECFEYGN